MSELIEPVDLIKRMRAGVEHIYAALDRRRDCLPYFGWNPLCDQPAPFARHTFGGDNPHVTGRFLDALSRCNAIAEMPADQEADAALAKLLYGSFGPDDFAYDEMDDQRAALMHNNREVLLGLMALHQWKHDPDALPRAARLVRKLEEISRKNGEFPGHRFDGNKWQSADDTEGAAPTTSGRMISALLLYYRLSGDEAGIKLAERFAQTMLDRYFTENGAPKKQAGIHLHSIEGTMTGLIEFGLVTCQKHYVEFGKKMYDVGLRPYRMSTGWAQENIAMYNRGEANNTTDFIETALLLAAAGWDEYYQDAERMIRNGLLRYQILDTSWIAVPTQPPPDTDIRTYRDIAERIRGGFCFATPNGFNSYNTDLTGGSLQGLCETWHNAITEKGGQVRVNLFFSQSHEGIDLISHIPREGQLLISTSRDIDLAVRVPKWAETTEATLAGKPLPCSIEGNYLRVGPVLAGSKVEVRFGRGEEFQLTEVVGADSYTTRWICDTVVAICPPGKIMPLYLGNVG